MVILDPVEDFLFIFFMNLVPLKALDKVMCACVGVVHLPHAKSKRGQLGRLQSDTPRWGKFLEVTGI
jgi:hypothetical protein